MVSVSATYGAILLGGFVAAAYVGFHNLYSNHCPQLTSPLSRFSGIVTVQSFIYLKLYPTDLAWRKAIVSRIEGVYALPTMPSVSAGRLLRHGWYPPFTFCLQVLNTPLGSWTPLIPHLFLHHYGFT